MSKSEEIEKINQLLQQIGECEIRDSANKLNLSNIKEVVSDNFALRGSIFQNDSQHIKPVRQEKSWSDFVKEMSGEV